MSLTGAFNKFFGNSVARNLEEDLNQELDAADFQPRLDPNWKPCSDIKVHPVTVNPTKAWEMIAVKQDVKVIKQLSPNTPIFKNKVRFVCISDTHNRTDKLLVPPGDVLLHSGDYTNVGRTQEVEHFNEFLGTLPHKHKIVIAGNHDIPFDPAFLESDTKGRQWGLNMPEIRDYLESKGCKSMKGLLTNCTYIEDSETSVYGIRIWGSPWQPWFGGWAFNLERGQACLDYWNKIPEGIDILMTHGPPIGHGDDCDDGQRAGCVELLSTIQQRVRPKFHIYGHIHEGYGVTTDGFTTFVNASTCNYSYRPVNPPIIFDFPLPMGVEKSNFDRLSATPMEDDITWGGATADGPSTDMDMDMI